MVAAFEIWESPDGRSRFYFSHSDHQFTTGVLVLQPGAKLPKHNRPFANENLIQLQGDCKMTLLDENDHIQTEKSLHIGDSLRMDKGQWHIHENTSADVSLTLFKAEGDITAVMEVVRASFTKIG